MDGFKRRAGFPGRWIVLIGIALFSAGLQNAEAANCAPGRVSASPEIGRLQRQIAANRAFQIKYSCAAVSTFACREIAGRIVQASARLASLSGRPRQSCGKPVVADRAPLRRQTAAVRNSTVAYAVPRIRAKIETRCVRLSDGYSFPTPNSGYHTAKDMDVIAAQCKFICDEPAMDVYRMTSASRNTDEMVSVTTGARYAELPNAGAYRMATPLKTCDMARFYKTVLAKTAAAVSNPAIPSVNSVQPDEAVALNVPLLGDVGLRGTTSFVPQPVRKVRIVGGSFMPVD